MTSTVKRTKGSVVYPVIKYALKKLGADISLARRTRKISTADFARQIGVSRATLNRLESGDAGCSLNTFAMACFALGQLERFRDILDQSADDIGLMLLSQSIPKRVKNQKTIIKQARDGTESDFW